VGLLLRCHPKPDADWAGHIKMFISQVPDGLFLADAGWLEDQIFSLPLSSHTTPSVGGCTTLPRPHLPAAKRRIQVHPPLPALFARGSVVGNFGIFRVCLLFLAQLADADLEKLVRDASSSRPRTHVIRPLPFRPFHTTFLNPF